jgi:hypothetical protein
VVSITYPSAQWLLPNRVAYWRGGKMARGVIVMLVVATLAVGCQALSVTDVLEVDMQRHPELYTDEATGRRLLQGGTFDWASLVPEGGFQQVRAARKPVPHARPCMCCCQLVALCGRLLRGLRAPPVQQLLGPISQLVTIKTPRLLEAARCKASC